ncbi:MAG: hypothetical protein AAB804_03325 [Patescibacteria group bacterium]
MVDETKDPIDASKGVPANAQEIKPKATVPPQPAAAPEPEARILEEVVVRAAPKPAPPVPKVEASTPVKMPPASPPGIPAAPPPAAPILVPPPVQTTPSIPKPVTPEPPALHPSSAEAASPLSLTPSVQKPEALGTDIAKILKAVQLPERRDQKGSADTATPPPVSAQKIPQAEVVSETPAVVTPREGERKKEMVVPVHTLKDDLQGVVRDTKMSVVKAVSLEEDRRTHKKQEAEEAPAKAQRSKRTSGIIFAVLLLLMIGGAALFGVYTVAQQRTGAPPPITSDSILFSEQSILFSLSENSPNDLKRTLAAARTSSSGTLGSITRIIPVVTITDPDGAAQSRPATFAEFIRSLGTNAPDDLIRALDNDFFFGIHTVDENAPLLVIPISSYDHAFAGMLAWEATLNADLAPAFTAVPRLKTDQSGIPVQRTFQDLVMRNYDVRALKDDAGEIQLYYSFPTQNMLVIAESPYSFTEVLSRLQANRQM